ncbi:ABC transporter substrate-binding protein [Roseomonas marmotae]|uniref:ABC transporter substrate-binding protein n=1 Tax=Roseomonas marmotae TaxID=2768161 RepID=A0ABS3KC47_9PROT|nr:ABC transporter substrate-binding protein [Roseomonas marmotae]MBO1074552.1 ABC transporter substrate-binding protein [Roseomonas marmotae]QTI81585.1 ABC transporter substrate-binding protein [Roseomonas marmotae]
MKRRSLLGALPVALLGAPGLVRAQAPIQVTDVLGRSVTLPGPARRVLLTQARHVLAMSLLHPDPVSLVVGWGDDLRRMNPPDYAAVRARFPQADKVPVISRGRADGISFEAIVTLQPDLVVFSLGALRLVGETLPDQLAAVGIPNIVIDFFNDPMKNTRQSIRVLGQVLGLEERAAAFDAFYASQLAAIASRLEGLGEARPPVLVHAHAGGTPCCSSPGKSAFDSMIRFAGGHNIGADILPGAVGELSLEYIIDRDPRVYVATGGPYAGRGGITLGPAGVPQTAARELVEVIRRSRLDVLPAVREGRAHAIWHGFNDTPAHLIMLQALARWFHPDRCGDLDPAATMAALNERFLSIPMEGAHWIDLPAGAL